MKYFSSILLAIFVKHVKAEFIESCDSKIYCQGLLLHTIQMANLFDDSKPFVDMNQKQSPEQTLKNFMDLMKATNNNPSRNELILFINDNFESIDLVSCTPLDFDPNPTFLNKINNPQFKSFAKNLISIWPNLTRRINVSVKKNPERYSLIPVPNGFIVPGGRFKEIYYWDTYWIIKGLLISGMNKTVRGILENFLFLINKYGFIPNGNRVYYLNRSQPPLFALMVDLYIDATNNTAWLEKNVDTIEKELNWWWNNRRIKVKKYEMFRYHVKSNTPRPEMYYDDVKTCETFPETLRESCYINLKSGAESGWDFSSRWLFDNNRQPSTNLSLIDITHIIPVDLNAFLCKAFELLARFYAMFNNNKKSTFWYQRRDDLKEAITDIMYDEEEGIWFDFDLISNKQNKAFYPTNFVPLWADAYDLTQKEYYGQKATNYFNRNKIGKFLGGIPSSLMTSGQQWDLPNAWPHLQEFVILGLKKTGYKKAMNLARAQAELVLESFMKGFEDTGSMFEKYDAFTPGKYGSGGEYMVQLGFGWTNGVALHLIEQFFTNSKRRHGKPRTDEIEEIQENLYQ